MDDYSNNIHTAYLLTGGNLGNRQANLLKAIELIEQFCGAITAQSSIYETAAWGYTEQPNFLNQVLKLNTSLEPATLMQKILWIEEQLGRIRTVKMGPRIIDIDILLMDELILNTELLQLPHPQLPNRRFVLMPLAEIAGNEIHPVEKKTINQLLSNCADSLNVQKI